MQPASRIQVASQDEGAHVLERLVRAIHVSTLEAGDLHRATATSECSAPRQQGAQDSAPSLRSHSCPSGALDCLQLPKESKEIRQTEISRSLEKRERERKGKEREGKGREGKGREAADADTVRCDGCCSPASPWTSVTTPSWIKRWNTCWLLPSWLAIMPSS
eukprot:scaffold462_cov195-Pinguiococcus_pyrenoidosus.AAC.15